MDLDVWIKKIGENIRTQRNALGYSQEKLAELAEVHISYLGEIERGQRVPSLKILWKLSSVCKLGLSQLLTASPDSTEHIIEEASYILTNLPVKQKNQAIKILRILAEDGEIDT